MKPDKIYKKKNKKCCQCEKIVEYARDIICGKENAFICPDCDEIMARDSLVQIWVSPSQNIYSTKKVLK